MVGELDPENAETGRARAWLAPDPLRRASCQTVVSTVDDVDLVQGRVATVLALADLARGVVGAYGIGAGAAAAVPAFVTAG